MQVICGNLLLELSLKKHHKIILSEAQCPEVPGQKSKDRIGSQVTKLLIVFWYEKKTNPKLWLAFCEFENKKFLWFGPKIWCGIKNFNYVNTSKILIWKGFWPCWIPFLIIFTKMDFFNFFLNHSLYMMYTLAYCYPEGQTVFENKYFWKVLLPQLEAKVTKYVSVGKWLRCSSIKSTKKQKNWHPSVKTLIC